MFWLHLHILTGGHHQHFKRFKTVNRFAKQMIQLIQGFGKVCFSQQYRESSKLTSTLLQLHYTISAVFLDISVQNKSSHLSDMYSQSRNDL